MNIPNKRNEFEILNNNPHFKLFLERVRRLSASKRIKNPNLIFINGADGSGKTTCTKLLSSDKTLNFTYRYHYAGFLYKILTLLKKFADKDFVHPIVAFPIYGFCYFIDTATWRFINRPTILDSTGSIRFPAFNIAYFFKSFGNSSLFWSLMYYSVKLFGGNVSPQKSFLLVATNEELIHRNRQFAELRPAINTVCIKLCNILYNSTIIDTTKIDQIAVSNKIKLGLSKKNV